MSLILEALKKSEANRRLGQAPDLGTPIAHARRERSPAWAWIVIVLAIGAGLWWWLGRSSVPAPVTSAHVPNNAPVAASSNDRPIARGRTPAHPAGVVKQQQMPGPDNWVVAHNSRGTTPPSSRNSQPAPVVAVAARERAPKTSQTRDKAPPPHPEAAAQPVASSVPPAATATTSAPTPIAAAKPDAPAYYELPFATRKALPQLNLSVHVYTANPKLRFVILDGTRLAEGDTSPDNISVREIRPDGVVLEFKGQRFFYPRDGQ